MDERLNKTYTIMVVMEKICSQYIIITLCFYFLFAVIGDGPIQRENLTDFELCTNGVYWVLVLVVMTQAILYQKGGNHEIGVQEYLRLI